MRACTQRTGGAYWQGPLSWFTMASPPEQDLPSLRMPDLPPAPPTRTIIRRLPSSCSFGAFHTGRLSIEDFNMSRTPLHPCPGGGTLNLILTNAYSSLRLRVRPRQPDTV